MMNDEYKKFHSYCRKKKSLLSLIIIYKWPFALIIDSVTQRAAEEFSGGWYTVSCRAGTLCPTPTVWSFFPRVRSPARWYRVLPSLPRGPSQMGNGRKVPGQRYVLHYCSLNLISLVSLLSKIQFIFILDCYLIYNSSA